jgi:putative membrane protein
MMLDADFVDSTAEGAESRAIGKEGRMFALRRIVTAGGGLALALMAPMITLQAQVTAPGTNPGKPGTPTTNPAPAPTANPAATPSQTGDREMTNDLPFLREAAGVNLMEIRLGQLAQSKASNAAVKQFGQRMVNDHTRLEQDLSSMVSANGIALNPTLTPAQSDNIARLQNLSGPQFDQAYMSMMIQGHQTDVAQFDTQSRNADSPQVREFAARSLPILQQHLSLAQQVGSQVNGVVTTTPKPGQGRQADVRADNEFIREVVADATLEMRMAQLAERKAQSSAVKQLASRIAADHNRLQNDWLAIASSNGQPFKPGFGSNHKAKLDAIQKLSGRAFDRAYISTVVRDHRDYINYFEKEGRSANASQVRELVNRDLPTLRSDFNQAKQVGAQIGADVNVTLRSERGSAKK